LKNGEYLVGDKKLGKEMVWRAKCLVLEERSN